MSSIQIPLVDLQAQYRKIKPEIMQAIEDVLEDMHLFLGPQSQAFEADFAEYCGCHEGVSLSTGTDALILALRACEIGPGDEVITVSNTFIATVEAIAAVGATPVFVDIEPDTYMMDCSQLAHVLTSQTRALLPVHLYGHPVDMRPLMEFARAHNLRVIEDASQAHGAAYEGQRVGSFGDIGAFSLYCSKNLGAYGEAGICVTNDEALAAKMRLLRDHGSRIRYYHDVIGVNARMDEVQAAVLNVKMRYLATWNQARQEHARQYSELLRGFLPAVPITRSNAEHVFYTYVVQVEDRQHFRDELASVGIATGIHYPVPIHLQPACASYGYTHGMLPVTEAAAERIVSLPMYPELIEQQIKSVVIAVKKSLSSGQMQVR